jgi:hypothetical protein
VNAEMLGGVCATACSKSESCKGGYICSQVGHEPSGSVFACNGSALASVLLEGPRSCS